MKAQVSFEYYFSLVLFVMFAMYVVFQTISVTSVYRAEVRNRLIKTEAYQISELLVNDLGEPIDWNTQTFWLPGWQYRQTITIDNTANSNTLTNYQILVNLDTASLISQGKMNQSCSDIRFTDSDGSLISYWIESGCNSANTKIWVKVPQIPASATKVIYLFYGNPAATSQSSITNTFIREIDGVQPVKGAWTFDEGLGTVAYDYSGNWNNGTLYNSTTVCSGGDCPNWVNGKFIKALRFDGINDYVNISNSPVLNPSSTGNITVEAWIYPLSFGGGNLGRIISKETGTTANPYALELRNTSSTYMNGIIFCIGNGTSETCTDTGCNNIIFLNTWQHVVGRYNRTHLSVFVNGEEKCSRTLSNYNFQQANTNLLIGNNPSNNRQFNGTIDEVRIYNKALTAGEIFDLYNNYGYVTPAYPGRVLIRNYTSLEPTTSMGAEVPSTAKTKRIGLSDESKNRTNILSTNKIQAFNQSCSTDYQLVTEQLGIEQDYQLEIIITDLTSGALLASCSPPIRTSRGSIAEVTRIAALDTGSYAKITVRVW